MGARLKTSWVAILLAVNLCLFCAANNALAQPLSVTLDDLVNGGQNFHSGNMLFADWFLLENGVANDDLGRSEVDLTQIIVTAADPFFGPGDLLDPGPGIVFTSTGAELSITQNGDVGASLNLEFTFEVIAFPFRIFNWTDSTLVANFDAGSSPGQNNREARIHDLIFFEDYSHEPELDTFYLNDDGAGGETDQSGITSSVTFRKVPYGRVYKFIDLSTRFDGESVGIFSFEQHFSQVLVPEPSTFALAALGLLSMCLTRRRRRR